MSIPQRFRTQINLTDGQIEIRRWRLDMDEYPIEQNSIHSQNDQVLADKT